MHTHLVHKICTCIIYMYVSSRTLASAAKKQSWQDPVRHMLKVAFRWP